MIYIYDLGGQYCHMISRRLYDAGIACKIVSATVRASELDEPAGIILSGGPQSVYAKNSPQVDAALLSLGVPVLGICYGHQWLAMMLGADVAVSTPEYGETIAVYLDRSGVFAGLPAADTVWMSHNDAVVRLPETCEVLAYTKDCAVAAFGLRDKNFFGVQFHPEVSHTEYGEQLLLNFATVCQVKRSETSDLAERLIDETRAHVGNRKVFFFVSGGVDSTVAFALCAKALRHDQLLGIYVDTGLMRLHETDELVATFEALGFADRLLVRDEADRFMAALVGVYEPEAKREIIGRTFVEVQHEVMVGEHLQDGWMLGQGTIYPDVIESGKGSSAKIKTHHNRCPEIQKLITDGLVVEPIRELYKDQVRDVGRQIDIPSRFLDRWPFPGPGLAIRCLCWVDGTAPLSHIEFADYEICRLPLRSVGVQGDARTYRSTIAVRGSLDHGRLVHLAKTFHRDRIIVFLGSKDAVTLSAGHVRAATLTPDRISTLQAADYIVRSYMEEHGLAPTVWQFPVVLLPLSYGAGESIVLRPVNSIDGMTVNFAELPEQARREMTEQILAIAGVDAVFLDASDKPPATIEWE